MKKPGNISASNPKVSSHNEWQLLLMAIPILIIAGFQVFWLRENYIKEKKNLEFRSNVVFKESIRRLQGKKLNLDRMMKDSTGKVKIAFMSDDPSIEFDGHPEEQLTSVLNDVTIHVNDSIRNSAVEIQKRPAVIIKDQRHAKD